MKLENSKKIYYTMGEVAEMFDVNASLIRFWEQKFDILKPDKNKKGNRLFTPVDVENLKLIYHLVKENGMTLAGAQKRLKENREGIERNLEIIDRLQGIRALLLEVKQELKLDERDEVAVFVESPIAERLLSGMEDVSVSEEVVVTEVIAPEFVSEQVVFDNGPDAEELACAEPVVSESVDFARAVSATAEGVAAAAAAAAAAEEEEEEEEGAQIPVFAQIPMFDDPQWAPAEPMVMENENADESEDKTDEIVDEGIAELQESQTQRPLVIEQTLF